ncbi:glycosyltransferase family 2 protein [Prosthecochloris vibrioformis]|uniref:Glycosyltransferase family 2 protein n=1 Tax=Prosthecochloris vibrioformis TaxID=1098 RepID=A0A5C4RXX7_PROVB|nr:glycosyltransferase family 2 protein [Prosthecochloris vibrioformis]TNJ35950.1 glycosyltransferase family 2 protein [Prosthecochloris vibrioformis]
MASFTHVEVIIPHYRGEDMLRRCLAALALSGYPSLSVCIVDNASGEQVLAACSAGSYPVRLVRLETNRGYAGGCNAGLWSSSAKYVVFLNDDTEPQPGWLEPLVAMAESDARIAVLQPKLLSLQAFRQGKREFDYAGAAGGMLDRLGYPWCLGRGLRGVEDDHGQYDSSREIFWASGAALFARREVITSAGGFDESFFMHMEEIDLCWRLKLQGFAIRSVPASEVLHEGGASLAAGSVSKVYYNHRNNLAMIVRNRGTVALPLLLALRLVLDMLTMAGYLAGRRDRLRKASAVLRAWFSLAGRAASLLQERKTIQAQRRVPDRMLFRNAPFSMILASLFGH